jgi:hypothetical protein
MKALQSAVIDYLISKGWSKGELSKGWGNSTVIKIEGGSNKQANTEASVTTFFFDKKYLISVGNTEILSETNPLLIYFIEN